MAGVKIEAAETVSRVWETYTGRYLRFRAVVAGGTSPLATPVISTHEATGTGGTLEPGVYRYKVTALDASGETVGSAEQTVTIASTGQKAKLVWAEVASATGYRVYRSPKNGGAGSENVYFAIGSGATHEYEDAGGAGTAGTPLGALAVPAITSIAASSPTAEEVAAGNGGRLVAGKYHYVMTALSAAGETVASNEVEVTITERQVVTLHWQKVVGATGGYRIYRSPVEGGAGTESEVIEVLGEASTSVIDTGVSTQQAWPPGTEIATPASVTATAEGSGGTLTAGTYRYKVTALNVRGETVGSTEVEATITAGQKVKVTWGAVTGATGGYRVYRTPQNGYPGSENSYQAVAGEGSTELLDAGSAGTQGTVHTFGTTGAPASTLPTPGGKTGQDAVLAINIQTVRDRKPGGTNNV
jgi:hypothetical protein